MPLPTGIRGFWPIDPGVTPIPDNWSEDTDYRDKYLQGVADTGGAPGTGGGWHNHTQSHTHTGNVHNHGFSGASAAPTVAELCTIAVKGGSISLPAGAHTHASALGSLTTITYQNDTTSPAGTYAKPPYMRVAVIQPDNDSQEYPDDALAFTDWSVAITGYATADGTGGTVDMTDRYIFGKDGVFEEAGETGGSATHDHTLTSTHTPNDHGHAAAQCGNSSTTKRCQAGAAKWPLSRPHHDVTMASKSLADVSSDAVDIDVASSHPVYTRLLAIQNTSGAAATPPGLILAYVDAVASLPDGWVVCDGTAGTLDLTASQIYATTDTAEIGETGGSNTHQHTSQAHGHTHTAAHDHYCTHVEAYTVGGTTGLATYCSFGSPKHNHSWTTLTVTPTINDTDFTTDAGNTRYSYREVTWVQYVGTVSVHIKGGHIQGGAIAAN